MTDLYSKDILREEILSLSGLDLMILQVVSLSSDPKVRFHIFQTINSKFCKRKQISSSTLYRSLDRLEKKGYLKSIPSKISDAVAVVATEKSKLLLMEVIKQRLVGIIDYETFIKEMFEDIMGKIGASRFSSLLFLNCEASPEIRFLNPIMELADETSILATDQAYSEYLAAGMDRSIRQATIYNKIIREPNDFFDGIILLGFEQNITPVGESLQTLMPEILRVAKPGGYVILPTVAPIPRPENFFLRVMADLLVEMKAFRSIKEEEMIKRLQTFGLEEIRVAEKKGLLFGWGKVGKA